MAGGVLRKIAELLVPEKFGPGKAGSQKPAEILASLREQLVTLGTQIEAHAALAPYPHVARRLSEIAAEKRADAEYLTSVLGNHGSFGVTSPSLATGKNHWERLRYDLRDQKGLENFIALNTPRLNAAYPEITDFLLKLAESQAAHRNVLADLLAVADPQANQT